jgi:hypothetical protein
MPNVPHKLPAEARSRKLAGSVAGAGPEQSDGPGDQLELAWQGAHPSAYGEGKCDHRASTNGDHGSRADSRFSSISRGRGTRLVSQPRE